MPPQDDRDWRCRALGIPGGYRGLYTLITESVNAPQRLVAKRLTAATLADLGYTQEGMQRLGYGREALELLGYLPKKPSPAGGRPEPEALPRTQLRPATPPRPRAGGKPLAELIETLDAQQLHALGYVIHHVKQEGIDARVAARAGFTLHELVTVYSAYELKNAGFTIGELRRHFDGSELRAAGFAARDMRREGFSIRQMQSFGYNDNQIRTAGYTQPELIEAGMMRQTVDKRGLQNW
ncbi:MAG: hypothetical protein HUU16_09315 [Candidatus Omnitrophica bacterium]|nr:hypothetical protein [Candidatus Omnitrophota bacterium]